MGRRFTVKGFIEQGSTTTPFDMTVLNESSRYDLVIRLLERLAEKAGQDVASSEHAPVIQELQQKLKDHAEYVWEHGEDMPEIKNWEWKDKGDLKTWKAEESEGQQGSTDSFQCEHGARNEI